MSDVQNATGASGGEGEAASILDFEMDELDGELQPNIIQPGDKAVEAAAQGDDDQAKSEDDASTEPNETEEAEAEPTETEVERLRDGSTTSRKEMKEAVEFRRNFERHKTEFESQRSEFGKHVAQIRSQEQFLSQILPVAIAVASKNLPPEPDPQLLKTDPFAHYEQTQLRNAAVAELQQLHQAANGRMQELSEQKQKAQTEYKREQNRLLGEKMPELKDETYRKTFEADVVKLGRDAGYSDAEIADIVDHRLFPVLKKAIAYDKLMAAKPKVEAKAKEAPPVVAPKPRMTSAQRDAQERRDQLNRLRRTGSARDAEAILAQFD